MKKFILALAILIAFPIVGSSQIQLTKKDNTAKKETTITMMWTFIYTYDDAYFLTLKSSNDFDDHFFISLGKNKEEILGSLNSLSEVLKTMSKDDSFELEDNIGNALSVTLDTALGRSLIFRSESRAGYGRVSPSELTKAIKWCKANVKE